MSAERRQEIKSFSSGEENKERRKDQPHSARVYAGQGFEPDSTIFSHQNAKRHISIAEEIIGSRIGETFPQTHPQLAIFLNNFLEAEEQRRQNGEGFRKPAKYVAGLSLGELNALLDAGAISFEDSIFLVNQRQIGYDQVKVGGLIYPIGLTDTDKRIGELRERFDIYISLINTKDQVIFAGTDSSIKEASSWLQQNGIKKVIRLPVKGPFHSPLMKEAEEYVSNALDQIDIKPAEVPIIANTTATPIQTPSDIKEELIRQITSTVLWKYIVEFMGRNGVTETAEIGNKKGILSNMNLKLLGGGLLLTAGAVTLWKLHHQPTE